VCGQPNEGLCEVGPAYCRHCDFLALAQVLKPL
jgi:hypothetical protein